MLLPAYRDGSIVNLMASLRAALGQGESYYGPLPDLPPAEVAEYRNVVLLVIDGMGYEFLMAAGAAEVLRNHVRARITSVFPPTTASAITSFLTGTAPQQHGLTGWFMYLKEIGTVSAVLPFAPRYGKAAFGKAGIDPVAFFGHRPFFDDLHVESYLVQPDYLMDSDFSRAHSGRARRHGYQDLQGLFDCVRRIVAHGRRAKFVYAYWAGLDSLGHHLGIGSPQALAHLVDLDRGFSELCTSLQGTDTLLLVTADHGQVDVASNSQLWVEDHPEIAGSLVLPLCGEPRLAYCYLRPHRRERFEAYVRGELGAVADLISSEDLVRLGAFGLGEPHPRLEARIGDYTLIMKEGYAIRDRLFGEDPPAHVGVHGGLSAAELYVPLITCQV